jgi:hypothetical protein
LAGTAQPRKPGPAPQDRHAQPFPAYSLARWTLSPSAGSRSRLAPRPTMEKDRLTAFSDGVIAVIITIMA